MKIKILLLLVSLASLAPLVGAKAQDISLLDTGAGQFSNNNFSITSNTPYLTDPNWTISLLSIDPGQTPPGGNPSGTAYLVPNNGVSIDGIPNYPFGSGYWASNNSLSCWISYSDPTQYGSDYTNDTFQYQLKFKALSTGTVYAGYLTDNTATVLVNGTQISTNASLGTTPGVSTFNTPTGFSFSAIAGSIYTVDVDVNNAPGGPDPTGANVEFAGITAMAVPEPTSWILGFIAMGSVLYLRRRSLLA